ncbi:unnamed protein product [Adineta steineri]|uniref:G-protein coupled receptors family 1 profile domain-containing protein n=2 Tax=Adineta steineri TaxID=433720 RepID=A0A818U5S6_9BILA|nr:unnamed protein product [Adineta steineri]
MDSVDNTTAIVKANFESWFIIMNITIIFFLILAILIAIIFLLIVAFNKTCHTVPIMLTTNSCLVEIIYGSITLSLAVFTFQNDTKQLAYQDALCTFRGYLAFVGTAIYLYSFTLQAIYRYISVVHTAHISWQSARVQTRRDLVVVRRIIIIIMILLTLGFPYVIFILISFVTKPPKYHLRIALFLLDLSQTLIMMTIFKFSQPVMDVVLKYKRLVSSRVQPTMT